MTEHLATLTAMFPTVEKPVLETVLQSHRNELEPSINALLEMTDPTAAAKERSQPPSSDNPTEVNLKNVHSLSISSSSLPLSHRLSPYLYLYRFRTLDGEERLSINELRLFFFRSVSLTSLFFFLSSPVYVAPFV